MRIQILAVVLGLVGTGAVAALAKDPAPALIVEYPVAERAKKADRLSLFPEQPTIGNTTSAPAVPSPPIASVPPPPAPQTKNIPEPRPVVVAPHRHEATDPTPKKRKRLASSKHPQAASLEKPLVRTVDCNGNGLDSLLRTMRLKPGCL